MKQVSRILGGILNFFFISFSAKYLERVVYYHSLFPPSHPLLNPMQSSFLPFSTGTSDKGGKWLCATWLTGISYSLPYLTSALFDTVAQFLLCKINFFLWFPSPYSHSYFSAYSIVLLYLLFMDWNPQHSVIGTCHFSHCNSSLGQTGGPKIGFPDPNLLLLVPNGLLFSMAHRYTNSIMSTIKPLIFTSASLWFSLFTLPLPTLLFPSVTSALICQPTYTLK